MRLKSIAVMSFAAVVALAPQAFAMTGGGGASGVSGSTSGLFSGTSTSGGTTSGTVTVTSGGSGSGSSTMPASGGAVTSPTTSTAPATLSATEPLAAFAVGLGLVAARFLRRRR